MFCQFKVYYSLTLFTPHLAPLYLTNFKDNYISLNVTFLYIFGLIMRDFAETLLTG